MRFANAYEEFSRGGNGGGETRFGQQPATMMRAFSWVANARSADAVVQDIVYFVTCPE